MNFVKTFALSAIGLGLMGCSKNDTEPNGNFNSYSTFETSYLSNYQSADNSLLLGFNHTANPLSGGLLSLDIDDSRISNYRVAAPLLEQRGMRATFYLHTSKDRYDSGNAGLFARGHEVNAHTVSHPDLTLLSDEEIVYELQESARILKTTTGSPVLGFASPFGAYNSRTLAFIREHFVFHRTIDEGLNSLDSDVYKLRAHTIRPDEPPEEVRAVINNAIRSNGWQILVFHCLDNIDPGCYRIDKFNQVLDEIEDSGIKMVTALEGVEILKEHSMRAKKPIGYFEGIDSYGRMYGWACDPDTPHKSIEVHFYSDNKLIASTIANRGSEMAVSSACGGGSKHRFSHNITPQQRNLLRSGSHKILAYGIDTDGYQNSSLNWSPQIYVLQIAEPTIINAGAGCDDRYCLWITASETDGNSYVERVRSFAAFSL